MKLIIISLLLSLVNTKVQAASLYYSTWDKREISVCFEDKTDDYIFALGKKRKRSKLSQKKRDKIKYYLTTLFTAESTGVYFVGFDQCSSEKIHDVHVRKFKTSIKDSVIGTVRAGEAHLGPYIGGQNVVNFKSTNSFAIVHEFMHVLGIHHEDIHQDSSCERGIIEEKDLYTTLHQWNSHDPQSVMSYCNLEKEGYLSNQDRELLKHLYMNKPIR